SGRSIRPSVRARSRASFASITRSDPYPIAGNASGPSLPLLKKPPEKLPQEVVPAPGQATGFARVKTVLQQQQLLAKVIDRGAAGLLVGRKTAVQNGFHAGLIKGAALRPAVRERPSHADRSDRIQPVRVLNDA